MTNRALALIEEWIRRFAYKDFAEKAEQSLIVVRSHAPCANSPHTFLIEHRIDRK